VTSPQHIEQATGLGFFTALNPSLAGVLRAKVDGVAPPVNPPPGFQAIRFAGGQISLVLTGAVATYTISATTNLANPQWNPVLSTNYPILPFTFVDTNATLPQ
jgi:hypothetical protein